MTLDRRMMIGGLATFAAPGCAKASGPAQPKTKGERLAAAARKQIGVTKGL